MILAFVGSGGKTTLLKRLAAQYREEGKTVFITTTTHMLAEPDTLLTDDPAPIIQALQETGYAMAGIPDGPKIKALSQKTFDAVCACADVVLVEADGSQCLPLKFPNDTEPVIPEHADEIFVVCGLNAIGKPAKEVCHRLTLVKNCLGIEDDTIITAAHVQKLVTEGYLKPLRQTYPDKKITLSPRHDGSLLQRVIAAVLQNEGDVSVIRPEWFAPPPHLIICGAGHVAKEVGALAAHLDFRVTVLDDRAELADPARFPTADRVICDSYDRLSDYLEPGAYYVVVTPNHKADLQCVRAILPTAYSYLGMIGSRRKVADTFEKLREDGFSEEQLGSVFAPIGLPIGAVTPAEIALSILAQIIAEKSKRHAASVDHTILNIDEPGVLCIITGKRGSAPRGAGSMLFVGADKCFGSIGGGEAEYLAIGHARENPAFAARTYDLHNRGSSGPDMICGGSIDVMFIPLSERG